MRLEFGTLGPNFLRFASTVFQCFTRHQSAQETVFSQGRATFKAIKTGIRYLSFYFQIYILNRIEVGQFTPHAPRVLWPPLTPFQQESMIRDLKCFRPLAALYA